MKNRLFSLASLCMVASVISMQAAAQPIQTAQALQKAQVAPGAVLTTPNAAVKALAVNPPELSFVGAQVYIPLFARGGVVVGAPNGGATFSLQESDQAPGTQLSASAPPLNLPVLAVRSCKDAHRAVLTLWVKNAGGDFDANTPDLGVTGTLAGQNVQSAIGKVPGSPQNQMRNIEGFQITPGPQSLKLSINKARGGGETNFANNDYTGTFEIRCVSKDNAQANTGSLLNKVPMEITKVPTQPVPPVPPEPPKGSEMNMIQGQSVVSQRATAIAQTTPMLNSMNEATKTVAGNIGGGPGSASPGAAASKSSLGNTMASQAIQFNKQMSWNDLKSKPDSTVLIGPNGEQKTIGEIKQLVANSKGLVKVPEQPITTPKLVSKFTDKLASVAKYSVAQKAAGSNSSNGRLDPALLETVKNTDIMERMKTCKEQGLPPKITKVYGDVTPGSDITIRGQCFEDQAREVRISGQNLKSVVRLVIKSWKSNSIIAQVPSLTGATAGQSELVVVTVDEKSTVSFPVDFTPTYELVDTSQFWSTCASVSDDYNDKKCRVGGFNADSHEFTGGLRTISDSYPFESDNTTWINKINQNCTINNVWTKFAHGDRFTRFEWGDGKPYEMPLRTFFKFSSYLDKHWYGDTIYRHGDYQLASDAYCPVGIAPNP